MKFTKRITEGNKYLESKWNEFQDTGGAVNN